MANVIAAQNDFYISNKWVPAHIPRRWFRLSKVLTGRAEREKEKGQGERAERADGLRRYYKISVVPLYHIYSRDIREERSLSVREQRVHTRDLAVDRREDTSG